MTTATNEQIREAFCKGLIDLLYSVNLNRRADPLGRAYWAKRYASGKVTLDQIAETFLGSKEAPTVEGRAFDKDGKLLYIGAEAQLGNDPDSFHVVAGFKKGFIYFAPTPGNLYPNDGKFESATRIPDFAGWG